MLRLAKKTRLKPEEATRKAVDFFGPKGYGLKVNEDSPLHARFEGGGGIVEVTSTAEGKGTSVEIVSQEWDHQAHEFMGKLK
jgi:hypothetical protein